MTREMIIEELEKRGIQAEAADQVKNGVTLQGIMFHMGGNIAPVIYVDSYLNSRMSIDAVVDEIIEALRHCKVPEIDMQKLLDKDFISEHLHIGFLRESNPDLVNKETCFDGIVSVLMLLCDDYNMKIKKGFLENINLTEEEAWEIAQKNVCKNSMYIKMSDQLGIPETEADNMIPMYILTNIQKYYGASSILDTDAVKKICTEMKTDKVYVIPSSIHETILVPKRCGRVNEFNQMVKDINNSTVRPEEQLADRVFLLDVKQYEHLR